MRAGSSWRRRGWAAGLLTTGACALLLLAAHSARAVDGANLSVDEQARLERGELVVREVSERRGELRLLGGTAFQVIDAAPDVVWRALLDTDRYQHMLPQLSEARVVEQGAASRTVFMRHSEPTDTTYYLDMKIDASRRDLSFRMNETRPRDIRAAWGFYTVRSFAGGRSLLVFGVLADPGDGLFKAALRPTVQGWLMRAPWMLKRFLESGGRNHYLEPSNAAPAPATASVYKVSAAR